MPETVLRTNFVESELINVKVEERPTDFIVTFTEQGLSGYSGPSGYSGRSGWSGISGWSGFGIPEAPMDGKIYARKDGAWIEIDV